MQATSDQNFRTFAMIVNSKKLRKFKHIVWKMNKFSGILL